MPEPPHADDAAPAAREPDSVRHRALCAALREACSAARTFPAGHPVRDASIAEFVVRTLEGLARRALGFELHGNTLFVDGIATGPDTEIHPLARALHDAGASGLVLERGIDADQLRALVAALAGEPDDPDFVVRLRRAGLRHVTLHFAGSDGATDPVAAASRPPAPWAALPAQRDPELRQLLEREERLDLRVAVGRHLLAGLESGTPDERWSALARRAVHELLATALRRCDLHAALTLLDEVQRSPATDAAWLADLHGVLHRTTDEAWFARCLAIARPADLRALGSLLLELGEEAWGRILAIPHLLQDPDVQRAIVSLAQVDPEPLRAHAEGAAGPRREMARALLTRIGTP
ncbi:MAG: hypothetical protein IT458_03835 [Planctomycetes bacterium]|nr:hypothetical protein [Planctomycetota bacterium]